MAQSFLLRSCKTILYDINYHPMSPVYCFSNELIAKPTSFSFSLNNTTSGSFISSPSTHTRTRKNHKPPSHQAQQHYDLCAPHLPHLDPHTNVLPLCLHRRRRNRLDINHLRLTPSVSVYVFFLASLFYSPAHPQTHRYDVVLDVPSKTDCQHAHANCNLELIVSVSINVAHRKWSRKLICFRVIGTEYHV